MVASGRAVMRPMDWRRRTAGVLIGLCLVVVPGFPASQAVAQPAKPAFHFPILPFRPVQQPPPAKPRPTLMPLVTGMPLAQARAILVRLGLRLEISRTASAAPAGRVLGQQPYPLQPVTTDSPVVLTVSDGSLVQAPEPRRPPSAAQPPPRLVIYPPQKTISPPVQGSAPRSPPVAPPVRPPVAPPVAPSRVRPTPVSVAPAAHAPRLAPPFSAAPARSSARSATVSAAQGVPPESAPQGPIGPAGPLGWAQTHPGWLAAIAALLTGAAAMVWAFRRPPVPPAPIATVPVIVTTSMLTVPTSTIENAQPATGPAIGLAWRIDPPQAQVHYPSDEEPSP